jgi:ribonuclease HII
MMKRNLLNSFKDQVQTSDLICGIDEAGRGPVLGPMVICGVFVDKNQLESLIGIGVKDSKKLTYKKRSELSTQIKKICQNHRIIIVSPKEIDSRIKLKITLNRLEEIKFSEIINEIKPNELYIDAADVREKRFGNSILKLLNYTPLKIMSKHKADDLFPVVSAASIVAKDTRDNLIFDLQRKYGDFGSGYPSDEKTVEFLRNWIKKYKKPPVIARKTWDTVRRIMEEEVLNRKITDFI